jgi:hypothetical protein
MTPNTPKTWWPDQTTYFLTSSTFLHYPYFNEPNKKLILLKQINKIKEKLNISNIIYSIAVNHLHLKFSLANGKDLAKVKQYLHGGTTFTYRKKYPMKYKDMWQTTKVLQINSPEVDWKVTGYIVGNLLKHKEVSKIEHLEGNIFCSYDEFVKEYGKEVVKDLIYSVINVYENNDGLVNFKEMNDLELKLKSR